jgi:hypothetical protein
MYLFHLGMMEGITWGLAFGSSWIETGSGTGSTFGFGATFFLGAAFLVGLRSGLGFLFTGISIFSNSRSDETPKD